MPHYRMKCGDSRELLKKLPDNFVSSIVTDPPYELGFSNHAWDRSGIAYDAKLWQQALRTLKPGGYLLAFGGTRTYHRVAVAIEDAGFELRDTIMWLYSTGFPKSLNVGNGYGTALKPAYEPIIVARKPLSGTVVQNMQAHRTGAMNIDACRIAGDPVPINRLETWSGFGQKERPAYTSTISTVGRFPANVVHDGSEDVLESFPLAGGQSVARFFYSAKASKNERNAGLDYLPDRFVGASNAAKADIKRGLTDTKHQSGVNTVKVMKNDHPTVKPMALARYLVRLVTPPKGICLDLFAGSGTFIVAALTEGFNAYGIDNDQHYVDIAEARVQHFLNEEPE